MIKKGSPSPWHVRGCLVKDPDGTMVAYVQHDKDRTKIAAAPLLADAISGLLSDLAELASLIDPAGGVEGCAQRVPGLLTRYNRAEAAIRASRGLST
tara:strand:- start:1681 stop:1971 length:291 start_codon:yes stop_codon:yes gene_type:complete